jgi:hypothetical protein
VNTRDPRDPRDSRGTDTGYRETRDTRYSNVEVRPDRSWLRWVIPAAILALLLPFLFHRGHQPEQRTTAAVEQHDTTAQHDTTTDQQHLAMAPTSVYVGSDSTLSDADRQKIADLANSARTGNGVALSGSKTQTDTVRQALISQGVPESQIEVREAPPGGDDGRVDITSK